METSPTRRTCYYCAASAMLRLMSIARCWRSAFDIAIAFGLQFGLTELRLGAFAGLLRSLRKAPSLTSSAQSTRRLANRPSHFMQTRRVTISNRLGLHARAAARLV